MGTLIAGILLGVWLMASPAVLGFDGAARISALVAGPIAASFSWIALSEVTRPLRRCNLVVGIWLVLSALVLHQPPGAAISSVLVGLFLGGTALLPYPIKGRYGGGWSALRGGDRSRIPDEVGGNA